MDATTGKPLLFKARELRELTSEEHMLLQSGYERAIDALPTKGSWC